MIAADRQRAGSAGFTLTELLVTTIISLMLGVAGFAFFRAQLRSFTDQAGSLDAVEGARAALDFIANDIRMAGADPTGGAHPNGLSQAQSSTLTIAWDGANSRPVDGAIDANESITYAFDAGAKQITKTVNGVTQTLITNATRLTFQYFLADGVTPAAMSGSPAVVTTPNNVVIVQMTVQVQTARATAITTVKLASHVAVRNRILARL